MTLYKTGLHSSGRGLAWSVTPALHYLAAIVEVAWFKVQKDIDHNMRQPGQQVQTCIQHCLYMYLKILFFNDRRIFWIYLQKQKKTENWEIFESKMFCLLLKIVGIIANRKHRFNSRQNAVTENYNTRKKSWEWAGLNRAAASLNRAAGILVFVVLSVIPVQPLLVELKQTTF